MKIINTLSFCRLIAITIVMSALSFSAFAEGDPIVKGNRLDGSLGQIKVDSIVMVIDSNLISTTYSSESKVSLGIDESLNMMIQSSFNASVALHIEATMSNNSVVPYDTVLRINYEGGSNFVREHALYIKGAYKISARVTQITTNAGWNVWNLLKVNAEISSSIQYDFSCSMNAVDNVAPETLSANTDKDELFVSWPNKVGADEYDLEWTYVDSSALASGQYGSPASPTLIFKHNASRVSVSETSYKIPLVYDSRGHLFFRVRSVQIAASGQRLEASWSSSASALGRFDYDGHERKLNWQSTTTYAEEGKRKTVVQYFDGSLRNRQTVTKDNTGDSTTIVAETLYDLQGRPTIQVLPSPTLENVIKYHQNFNTGAGGIEYTTEMYDVLGEDAPYCGWSADSMSSSTGASRYYSQENPEKNTGIHRFIPDARKYPYTETQYTQDNTGRINKQGGVGPVHKIGSGHEITYYYGTPSQEEIDALFGTEVGHYSHYQKTLVKDANGQFSVSYVDMHGRTIATALAGVPTHASLDTLSSYTQETITETISDPSSAVIKDLIIESKKGLVVPRTALHTFSYELSPQSLQLESCAGSICYDCAYDLTITISGSCSNEAFGGQPFDTTITNFTLGALDGSCNAPGFSFSFTKLLTEGSYEITKQLSVNRQAMDHYRDVVFTPANTCLNFEDFVNEQRTVIANIPCEANCDSCKANIGTWDDFRIQFLQNAGITTDTASYSGQAYKAYQEALAACAVLCDEVTEYDEIRNAMLADVSAPSGQYANIDNIDTYSIFSGTSPAYKLISNYLDEEGNIDSVYDELRDKYIRPQELSAQQFSAKFKSSWAEQLIIYHPEYCKLQLYETYAKSSSAWARKFEKVDTYEEAAAMGYLNPSNRNTSPFNSYNTWSGAHPGADPLAAVSGFASNVEGQMANYQNNGLSLWQLAAGMVACPEGSPTSCYTNVVPFNSSECDADKDMAWRNFRGIYLNLRKEFIDGIVAISSCNGSGLVDNLLNANHQPHFATATRLLADNDIAVPTNQSQAEALAASGRERMNESYDLMCQAYALQWREELSGCYDPTTLNSIIAKMIEVCKNGSDESHPFGASSIAPSSTYQYNSFQDVLDEYTGNNTSCTADRISAPKPYNSQVIYSDKPVWTKPDSCECEKVSQVYAQYQLDSSNYSGFSDFMEKKFQTTFSDSVFNVVRNLCADINGDCNFLTSPIILPPVLQCYSGDICVDCETINDAFNAFRLKYPIESQIIGGADSAAIRASALFDNYLNSKFGFSKSSGEYLRFIDSCQNYAQSVAQSSKDTLLDILSTFSQNIDPRRVIHFARASSGETTYDTRIYFKDGLAIYPVDSLGGSQTWYNTIQLTQSTGFCPADSFAIEYRIKFPPNASNGCCYTLHGPAGSPVFGVRSGKVYFEAFVNEFGKTYGSHHDDADTTYFQSIFVDSSEKVNDWNVVNIKTTLDKYEIYYNSALVIQIPRDTSILIPPTSNLGSNFMGSDFQMDYIKIVKGSKVIFFEDFLNPYTPAKATSDAFCNSNYDCESSFANYFNLRSGTTYNFRQIDSLYYSNTNNSLSVCESQDKPCDSLKTFIKKFNVNANPFRVKHALQSNGLVPPVFTDQDIMSNGYMRWTDSIRQNHQYRIWVYHQSYIEAGKFCLENGFSMENKVKHLRKVVSDSGDDIFYVTSHNVGYVIFRRATYPAGIYLRNITSRLDSNSMINLYSGTLLLDSNANSFLDWMLFKITVTPTHCRFYYNGVLKIEVPRSSFPLANATAFTNAMYGYQGAMDWIKLYDANGKEVYFQDFDDPENKGSVDPSFVCPPPVNDCNTSYVNYYNQQKGTSYNYNQIDSIYRACGVALNVCGLRPNVYPEVTLCGNFSPASPPVDINTITNCSDSSFYIHSVATELYRVYTDSLMGEFDSHYRAKCLEAYKSETFTVSHEVSEYHYTLYYYDQAGNLVKTVPPKGVVPNRNTSWLNEIKLKRALKETQLPSHSLATQYRYNTLNQVVAQQTPDAGVSEFWYDRLGRLVLSQNARQKAVSETVDNRLFSYTNYDYLGRITEVGQIKDNMGSTSVDDVLTRSQSSLESWINNRLSYKGQITNTIYDDEYDAFPLIDSRMIVQQRNLRNRVSYTTFTDTASGAFNQATFYCYDIHGNVDTLLQDYGPSWAFANVMNANGNRYKKIVYNYDLISGKVNKVSYQPGWADQMFHKYSYDAENRLTKVKTSVDNKSWEQDAGYEYYRHGPLARMELGQQKVQGIDYAYTLQGWLKGVNSTWLTSSTDMGGDGVIGGPNQYVSLDAIGFHLNYYDTSDYSAISQLNPFPGSYAYLNPEEYRPLFNGNISSMAVSNRALTGSGNVGGPLMFYNYRYDQLNRLTSMDAYTTTNWLSLNLMQQFRERISYDGNGNILTYLRRGHRSAFAMDNLSYVYNNNTNQLNRVDDQVSAGSYGTTAGDIPDIDDQAIDNYTYDEIGNLIKDNAEGITGIKWSVYGKILEISRTATAANPVKKIVYTYDAQGNRISKALIKNSGTTSYTWYVRDAQGNTLATYQSSGSSSVSNLMSLPLNVSERHMYGSSRLGIYSHTEDVDNGPGDMANTNAYKSYRGLKQYELSNHLGNVLATITDKKKAIDLGSNGTIDYYDADIVTAQDYYPFGMLMPGRIGYASSTGEWAGEPGGAGTNNYAVEADIAFRDPREDRLPEEYTATNSIEFNPGFESGSGDAFLAYISEAEIGSGGSGSGSSLTTGYYRYGFNGKENDNEVKGIGNQQDYGMRIYDSRLGKFLSVDPLQKQFPDLSPYHFAGNTPIQAVDLDGLEPKGFMETWEAKTDPYMTKWGYTVQDVYDHETKKVWTVMNYPNTNEYFYWETKYENSQGLFKPHNTSLNKDANKKWTGSFKEFKPQMLSQDRSVYYGALGMLSVPFTLIYGKATAAYLLSELLEEAVGVPIPDGPIDFFKYEMKQEAKEKIVKEMSEEVSENAKIIPRNSRLAGKIHPVTGVPFTKEGFPSFSNYLYKGDGPSSVRITFTGSRRLDDAAANKAAGYSSTPDGFTWHHKEDMTTMELVNSEIHKKTGHSGGVAVYEATNNVKYKD